MDICFWYLAFLMLSTRKHTLREAAKFSGLHMVHFSRWLKNQADIAVYNLNQLSKRQAKQFRGYVSVKRGSFRWSIMILIDSTLHNRSTLHTDNAKKFKHGKGYVIGHQWTNIVLLINDMIIPLPPIPFYSKRYSWENKIKLSLSAPASIAVEMANRFGMYRYRCSNRHLVLDIQCSSMVPFPFPSL